MIIVTIASIMGLLGLVVKLWFKNQRIEKYGKLSKDKILAIGEAERKTKISIDILKFFGKKLE